MAKIICGLYIILVFTYVSFVANASTESLDKKPNIVVILLDDMGFSDISSYGGEIPTPNIDKLASNGVKLSQFYNTARCSPTRASLLTGMYPHKAGMGYLAGFERQGSRGTLGYLHDRAVTAADVLSDAGYFTAMTGKWHLGHNETPPHKRGFQASLALPAGGVYFPDQASFKKGQKVVSPIFLNGKKLQLDDNRVSDEYWYGTDLWTDWGIKFIQEAEATNKPFFLYLSHVAPHFPVMAPQETIEKYRGRYMKGWEVLRRERYQRQIELGLLDENWLLPEMSPDVPDWDSLSREDKIRYDHIMAVYAAAMEHVDASVGRLTQYLKEQGQLDNTLILFLSDNGGSAESGPNGMSLGSPLGGPTSRVFVGQSWAELQNTPFKLYKHFSTEGGIATPFIAHWPTGISKRPEKEFLDTPAHVIDILPTLIDVSDATYPARYRDTDILPMNGVSLVPLFEGKRLSRPEPIFFEHEGNRAVRDGRWKLVSRLLGSWRLYDMDADRTETVDLFQKHPDIAQSMILQYEKWAQRDFVDQWIGKRRPDSGGLWSVKERLYEHKPGLIIPTRDNEE
ncbi:arylsulfatase [Marinimicrobium koreense]|uniref:Arylsulfatase n=1 Tax=Marinimicrobium koreense TaxID=306545 RepID=A0A3N1PAI9_9GAMM|nr:arylsulfatase [Marinimicrobium koreense]ROQ21706.1 arylsulfatase [Marinimicrobium koreense]